MSDAEQGDLLAEMRAGGLIDDETDAPQLTTAEPEDTAPEAEQLEMQPASADGRTWKGAEQLRPYLVRVDDLGESKGNPDKSKAHVARLKASLVRFGQTRPVLIDAGDGRTIIAGHHVWKAAKELGWTHVSAVAAEFESQESGRAFGVGDNILALIGNFENAEELQAAIRDGRINRKILEGQLDIIGEIGEEHLVGTGIDLDLLETMRAKTEQIPLITETEPWGGEAAESGEEAAARAAALAGYEPHKEIPLYMTLPQHELFSEHVRLLQNAWSIKGVMDTILRALEECYNREAAPVGEAVPDEAAPPETPTELAAEPVASGSPNGGEEGDGTPESAAATSGPDDDIPA